MELLAKLLEHITLAGVIAYFCAAFVCWFIAYGLEVYINGGSGVFKSFAGDFLENIPGGLERKVARLKEYVGPPRPHVSGVLSGKNRTWTFEEIRAAGEPAYRECAQRMFGSPLYFWGVVVGCYFLLGPIVIGSTVCLTLIFGILYDIRRALSRSFQWKPQKF